MGALAMAKNNDFRPRTKHIHARERYITEMVENNRCRLEYVSTRDMVADALTKALPREQHEYHTRAMGLIFGDEIKRTCKKCYIAYPTVNELHRHLRLVQHYCDGMTPLMKTMIDLQGLEES